jgi:hypothetical protein
MAKSYKSEILKLTGWSESEYKREYNRYRARVQNYNRAAGANASPQKMFYYAQKYKDDLSVTQRQIAQLPTTRPKSAGGKLSTPTAKLGADIAANAWLNLAAKSPRVARAIDDMRAGKITPAELNAIANEVLDTTKQHRYGKRPEGWTASQGDVWDVEPDPTYGYE